MKLRRIEELEKENESLKLKGKKCHELEEAFEERIVHLQKEIATLRIATSKVKKDFMI